MKKLLFVAVIACAALFVSCEKQGVSHTGDLTGDLYGVWAMDSKTIVTTNTNGKETRSEVDYTSVHFYLSLSEPRLAVAKKGSFTELDLKDVDVDGSLFSFNKDDKKISFDKRLWLTEGLTYSMDLKGTYDIVELTNNKLVFQQDVLGVKTIFSYHRYK